MSVIVEGKTKVIRPGASAGTILIETKDSLTAGDAARRESIPDISTDKTAQAANVFSLLQRHGIPTAFIERASERELLCHQCKMLPLELVVRRFAWGTFLLRHPDFRTDDNTPLRFDKPFYEFFHKHSVVAPPLVDTPYQTDEEDARQRYLRDGVWPQGVYTDPYIDAADRQWTLRSPKEPLSESRPLMQIEPMCPREERMEIIEFLMIPVFLALEKAWAGVETVHGPVTLVDMKMEIGRRVSDGKLLVADVIDNDSWRIWPGGDHSKQLDKQCFRDNQPLSSVAENYAIVTELTSRF